MSKSFFRFMILGLLILPMVSGGCNNSLQANPNILTPTLNLLLPSNTPTPTSQISILETATAGLDVSALSPCGEVPEPQLIKPQNDPNQVYLSGTLDLCWYTEDSFDMDSGILGHTDPGGNMDTTLTDVELRVRSTTFDSSIEYFLMGANNAYVTKSDSESPTIEYCQDKTSNPTLGGGILFGKPGLIGCVLTNEGRLGYIKIESIGRLGTEGLEMTFVTWDKK